MSPPTRNFENRTLYQGDNIDFLRGMNSETVDLIATDPPFNKGVKAFEGITAAGEGISYKDTWTWRDDVQDNWTQSIRQDHPSLYAVIRAANAAAGEDMGAFLCWLGVRVLAMHRILKPTGSIYLHVDHTAHAYAKAMMDAIFGRDNFRNEIVWCYAGGGQPRKDFPRKHDTILRYSQSVDYVFNRDEVRVPYDSDYKATVFAGDETRAPGRTYTPDPRGKVVEDWWRGIPRPYGDDHTGYPTQKPLALYERIIKASSNEGDMVLDPFAGCATTCVAAERLGREWVGMDINKEAGEVTLDRLEREVEGAMNWGSVVSMVNDFPKRTDGGKHAAPELVLVSPKAKARRIPVRQLRAELIETDGDYCQGCGWQPHLPDYYEVDHRQPKSRKGSDDIRNRVLLCAPCNSAKGNRLTLAELRERWIHEGRMMNPEWDMAWFLREGKWA